MADKTIRKIDSRRGKRGRRETFSFSGVEAQDHIDELVAEIRMTKSDLETYQSNASSSASAAAQSASDASGSSAAAQSALKSASEYAGSAESSAEASAAYAERAAEAISECEGYVSQAESSAASAAGSAGSAAGYAAEAKKAAESVTEKAAGVNTWNGRSGTVLPQSGDYTADMVGAVSEDTYNAKVTEIDKDLNTVGEDITALEKRVSANETAISSKANASEVVSSWNGRAGAVTPQKGDYTADMVGFGVKSITVSPTGWSTSATTINGTAYYTYAVTGLTIDDDHPEVSIGVSGTATLPTADEQTAFECIKYGVASGSTLTLYAESVPETSFVINVRGVS